MVEFDTLFLIPLLPLCGAALLGLFGKRLDKELATIIALAAVFGAFAVTCIATYTVYTRDSAVQNFLWTWIQSGRVRIDLTLGLDRLSATLMLVVTGVGFLIHLYSTGYMHDDPSYNRFFAYLNLFIFAMSVLVLGRSLPVMFIGWEGVGLASYLLIGFWYADEAKARAGRKAGGLVAKGGVHADARAAVACPSRGCAEREGEQQDRDESRDVHVPSAAWGGVSRLPPLHTLRAPAGLRTRTGIPARHAKGARPMSPRARSRQAGISGRGAP